MAPRTALSIRRWYSWNCSAVICAFSALSNSGRMSIWWRASAIASSLASMRSMTPRTSGVISTLSAVSFW